MNNQDATKNNPSKVGESLQKLQYIKPGVLSEDPFETMALSCANDSIPCIIAPKS